MSELSEYEFYDFHSHGNEQVFFSQMGYFFASSKVRRECGGYPLKDGPMYHWFAARRVGKERVLAFINIEYCGDHIRIRDGYVRPEARQRGLFRELRGRVLAHCDHLNVDCKMTLRSDDAANFLSLGFQITSQRGHWVTMERKRCHELRA